MSPVQPNLAAWPLCVSILASIGGSSVSSPPPPPAGPPPAVATTRPDTPARPAPAAPAPAAPADPAVALLRTLERSAADLTGFTASVFYQTEDALLGDTVSRKGNLVYSVEPEKQAKSFAILFDTVIENNRGRAYRRTYVFSGRWLAEVDYAQKLFVKREIVRPGEIFDPLALGEGPIPLPIGQPADKVTARFEVALVDLPKTGPLAKIKLPVDGIRLVPRPGMDVAEDFAQVDLFYDRATHLPAGIEIIEINGDRKTIRLGDLARNPVLDPETLELLKITDPDPTEWTIDVRPLKR